jgi:5'(3')-deoxyribonucleotidase
MKYKRIGIDIDDVIRDFIGTVYKVYLEIYPEHKNKIKPINGWSMTETFPIGEAIYDFIFDKYAKRIFYEDATVLPSAGEGLDELAEMGYDLIVITSQRPKCVQYTRLFLDYYEFPISETYILEMDNDFKIKNKSDIPVDIMIDDNHDTIMEFYNRGIEIVCQARPWNKKHHSEYKTLGIPIVNNFAQFVDYIKMKEAEHNG